MGETASGRRRAALGTRRRKQRLLTAAGGIAALSNKTTIGMEAFLIRRVGDHRAEQTGVEDNVPRANEDGWSNNPVPVALPTDVTPKSRGSAVVPYFKHLRGRSYLCKVCEERKPNNPRNIIQRQEDNSTNSFWRHFKAKHPERHNQLKGLNINKTRTTDTTLRGGQGMASGPRRKPLIGRTDDETKNVITRFVCCTDTSFQAIGHITFKEMWRYATQIELDPPSSKVIRSWTTVMFDQMKEEVRELFRDIRRVSLTADVWTADNGLGLLGITVHWIDASWQHQETVLGIHDIAGKHDGESMAEKLLNITDYFGLTPKLYAITTDNATSNMKMLSMIAKAVREVNPHFTKRRHIPCVAHMLNILVQSAMSTLEILPPAPIEVPEADLPIDDGTDDELRFTEEGMETEDVSTSEKLSLSTAVSKLRIIVHAINSSEKQKLEFISLCKERVKGNEMTDNKMPMLDCPTKWKSTFEMVATALRKQDVINIMSLTCPTNGRMTKISQDEWDLLTRFYHILDRFCGTSKHVTQSENVTISDVFNLLQALQIHLDEAIVATREARVPMGSKRMHEEDNTCLESACMAMKKKLDEYMKVLYCNKAIIASAILDPYHKGNMLDTQTKEKGITFILSLLSAIPSESSPSSSQSQQVTIQPSIDYWIRSVTKKKGLPTSRRTPSQELIDYLAEVLSDDYEASPLNWWANSGRIRYPNLADVARQVLSVSLTCAPAEQLFSAGNAVEAYGKNCLKAKSIEALVALRCWLSAENKRWYDVVVEDSDEED